MGSRDITFTQVCDFVRGEAKKEPKLLDATDLLLGLALACAPIAVGPAVALLLPTITVKNELVKIGKSILEKIAKKKDNDHLARTARMEMGYRLICYTAFFDALDGTTPQWMRDRLKPLPAEKALLASEALPPEACAEGPAPEETRIADRDNPIADISIALPHPAESVEEHLKRLEPIWKRMAQGFRDFVGKLALSEEMTEKERPEFQSMIEKLPLVAAQQYSAQYFELCLKFPEFAIWANLQEHKATRARVAELPAYFQAYAKSTEAAIDVGLARLQQAVASIPESLRVARAEALAKGLSAHYTARLREPIVDDRDEGGSDAPRLSFPQVQHAFIPQAFRVIRSGGPVRRLEDDSMWEGVPRRSDLGPFLLSYLTSPYSTDAPLLILGHPGGGKSLLTVVLAAQLMSKHFTVVRVPLREVSADAGIVTQIEEAIRRVTAVGADPWSKLSGAFKNNPPVVILDGYDELLQASGKVFANYLIEVQNFQRNEAEQGRPVRVLVTSRVTLIDKATIPGGSTILRLLEFDKPRRDRWIATWNKANAGYFEQTTTKPFELPSEKKSGAEKILLLAEQPLLLLMLALYDSQNNQLGESESLDRTRLYDSLLRRFVERERRKDKKFLELEPKDQKRRIDNEMQRLSVAALGMYNRRSVHILAFDLDADLRFFELERQSQAVSGRAMTQAELLLGSFFFVHKSEAHDRTGSTGSESYAFEFLHNTFGEFLTADFIVRRTVQATAALLASRASEDLSSQLEKMLNSADGFPRQWLASLIYTPLFTRPVVLEMIQEWTPHVLAERALSLEAFVTEFEHIVMNQLTRLLSKREMPSLIHKESVDEGFRAPFGDYPLVGHIAIYSLNLLLLRLTLSPRPFVLDESRVRSHDDGARPWDRLVNLWRAWFSLENLSGLTGVIAASRDSGKVILRQATPPQVAEARDRLETFLNVSLAVADDLSAGLAGLVHFERAEPAPTALRSLRERLAGEKIGVDFEVAVRQLRWSARKVEPPQAMEFIALAGEALRIGITSGRAPDDLEVVARLLLVGVKRVSRTIEARRHVQELADSQRLIENGLPWPVLRDLIDRSPGAALLWIQALRQVGGRPLWRRLDPDFVDRFMHDPRFMMEGRLRDPESAVAWVQIVREIAGSGAWRRFGPKFIDRMFHPRFLVEMAEWSPEAAVSWVQLVRDLGGADRLFLRVEGEMLDRFLDARFLLDLIERSPETAVAWVQLVRDLGGAERLLRTMEPELVSRFLDPRFLWELSERNPEAAGVWVQMVRELGGVRALVDRVGPEFMQRALDPEFLLDLSERSPQAAAFWMQVARQVGGVEQLRHAVDPRVWRRILDPRFVGELSTRSPQAVVFWLELVRELGGLQNIPADVAPDLLRRVLSPRFLRDVVARSSESVAVWFEVVNVLGAQEQLLRAMEPELVETLLDDRLLLDLTIRDPAAALALARTVFDLRLPERVRRGRPERTPSWLRPAVLIAVGERSSRVALYCLARLAEDRPGRNPRSWGSSVDEAIAAWVRRGRAGSHPGGLVAATRLATMLGSRTSKEAVVRAFLEAQSGGLLLVAAPLALLADVKALVAELDNEELGAAVGALVAELPGDHSRVLSDQALRERGLSQD